MPGCKVGDLAVIIGPSKINDPILMPLLKNLGKFVRIEKDNTALFYELVKPRTPKYTSKAFQIKVLGSPILVPRRNEKTNVNELIWVKEVTLYDDEWLQPLIGLFNRFPKEERDKLHEEEKQRIKAKALKQIESGSRYPLIILPKKK